MPSENNCIIEDVDNEVNFLNPYDFNDSDSFDSSDDDDGNCVNPWENNSSVSLEDNDGLESFTFGDNALINKNDDKLHVIFVNFFDDCIDDAMYVHEFLGEVEEEMDGSERDVLLNSEKEREDEKQEIMVEGVENENDVLESFTFDPSEGVENENVKEEVEDKEKTRNESVREEVEEKVRNDEKEFEELVITELALSAMDELIQMAQLKERLWVSSMDHNTVVLDKQEYVRFFSRATIAATNLKGCKIEAGMLQEVTSEVY
nr:homeobox-leucine zipper protein HDG2 [Ipomoea batatas]